ncbi:MAG TPA: PAS-domain containing protein [Stellaceae bacterium]|nr:PAS-domain containing protein [Stellaceae bacterium]
MGQVRVLEKKKAAVAPAMPATPAVLSTLFDRNGAILFQNDVARDDFAAPNDGKRALCALVCHFADRDEGRRLFETASAGEWVRAETEVYTKSGIVRRLVQLSRGTGAGGETAIVLNERSSAPRAPGDAELIRVFAQAGADWFWETDATMRLTFVSNRPDLSTISGGETFIGRIIYESLPGVEDLDRATLRETIGRREAFRDVRYTRRTVSGRRCHYSVSGAPIFDADGVFTGYRGTGRDRTPSVEAEERAATAQANLIATIAALKQRENELAEKSALLQATLDNMHQGVLVNDANSRVVMWNNRFIEMNGLTPDMIRPGMKATELVRCAAAAGEYGGGDAHALTGRRLAQLRGSTEESVRVRPNGTVIEHHTNKMPDGGAIRTFTDITALKEQQRRLDDQHRLLTATLGNMDQGMLVLDADLRVRLWNDRLLDLLGVPHGLWRVGTRLIDMVTAMHRHAGKDDPRYAEMVAARIADFSQPGAMAMPSENFQGRDIERRRRPLPDGGIVLTYTDVTEARKRESELAEKSALLSAVLENMDQGIMVMDAGNRARMWNERLVTQYALPPGFLRVGMPIEEIVAQLARQGELGAGDPAELTQRRMAELSTESNRVFSRRLRNNMVIERRRRDMPDGGSVLTHTDVTDLTQRERALEEKSTLLAATLDNMDQGMLVLDAGMNIRSWNRRVIDLLGVPDDMIHVGRPMADIVRFIGARGGAAMENLEERVARRLVEFREGGGRVMTDLGPHGRIIERRSRAMPDGGLVVTYADITELKLRESALEEKGALLSATLDNMDQGMLVLDADMKIRSWNGRVVELLNLTHDTLHVGMPARDLVRRLGERMGQAADELEHTVSVRIGEFRSGGPRVLSGPTLDGRVVERRSRPMPDGGVVITYSDVTERKRREDLLAENSALLSATLDNMDQGLVVIDGDSRTKLWNNRLVEMFNLPPDVMRAGRPFRDILRHFIEAYGTPPEKVEAIVAERMREIEGEPLPVIDRHRPDGRVIERRRRVMPQGGSVITYGDVTARKRGEVALKRAKEEAEVASRSKTEFLANMSHELRTPLNAIIGFSDILVRQLFGPLGQDRYAEYARDIHDSGQHLLNLINDVLDISKVEVNKIELAEENVDIPGVIESCLRLVRDRATAGGVAIEIKTQDKLPALRGDDRRLKQILLNLVSNAVKFTPAGGQVQIRAEADSGGFRFVVADTGIGIAKADIETALRPFGQIDSSLARRYEGTGLGLPLSRSLTELHGGRLEIESEPGAGTTVTVWLPPSRLT